MLIDKMNIVDTIQKMIAAGKSLPQRDRIRCASNPAEEQEKVLDETVNLWWDLFKNEHIGVELWEKATNKAIMLNGIPKLEVSIINPALMSVALSKVQEEMLAEQLAKREQQKQEEKRHDYGFPFPEMGALISYHLKHHHGEFIPLPAPDVVRSWAAHGGWKDETIERNLIKLRIYYNFGQYAKRDSVKMPLKLSFKDKDIVSIEFVS